MRSLNTNSPSYATIKQNLTVYNQLLKKSIREAKTIYYNNEFNQNRSNMRKMWNTISEIIHKQKNNHTSIKKICFQEKYISDQAEIANTFNDFFINIGPNLMKNIIQKDQSNISYRKYINASILSSFNFQLIDDESLRKTLNSLRTKSSSGYDGISTRLLKFLAPALISPLRLIINQSLITGIYPDKLKTAKVIPLYKKGDKTKCDNYRPISLLCAISKLFEKVVYNQLYDYFTKNKLFHDNQYGFRTKHSTELAVTELIDRVLLNIDNKQVPFAVFMDLSKAFDTLDHKILIDKLHHYGIRGISLMWFESYLSKRTQYVEIDNFKSSPQTITTGVPQGSILGPLLFLIYMNDMTQASSIFKFILYADDTTLFSALDYLPSLDIPASSELINKELARVGEWLIINRLSINITKTKYMLFHPKQKDVSHMTLEPTLNGEKIEQVDSFNFLGVVIDKHISWKYHAEMLSNKISKYCGVLSRLKNYLPLFILRTLYFSMVHSHLNYSLLTWGFDSNRIVKLQKRCVRIITRSKYNAHTQPLMKQLNILSVPDMLLLNSMKFYYKYKHKEVPDYFASFTLHTQGSTHDYNTRQRDDIRTNRTRINLTEKCLRNYLPKTINSIPNHILTRIDTHSIEGFASAVKHYLISKYSIECQDENCYVCQRQPRSWFVNCNHVHDLWIAHR